MNEILWDAIVVGSGPTAVHAAQTLNEHGLKVLMLDGGCIPGDDVSPVPRGAFADLRREDPEQYRYFLGNRFESVAWDGSLSAVQVSPARAHIFAKTSEMTPVHSRTFHLLESLALGGLAVGWGLGCCVFSEAELARCGLPIR